MTQKAFFEKLRLTIDKLEKSLPETINETVNMSEEQFWDLFEDHVRSNGLD